MSVKIFNWRERKDGVGNTLHAFKPGQTVLNVKKRVYTIRDSTVYSRLCKRKKYYAIEFM